MIDIIKIQNIEEIIIFMKEEDQILYLEVLEEEEEAIKYTF